MDLCVMPMASCASLRVQPRAQLDGSCLSPRRAGGDAPRCAALRSIAGCGAMRCGVMRVMRREEQNEYFLQTSQWTDTHPSQLLGSGCPFKRYDLHTLTLEELKVTPAAHACLGGGGCAHLQLARACNFDGLRGACKLEVGMAAIGHAGAQYKKLHAHRVCVWACYFRTHGGMRGLPAVRGSPLPLLLPLPCRPCRNRRRSRRHTA